MTIRSLAVALAASAALSAAAAAQDFVPPDQGRRPSPDAGASGFRLGILGFSTRGGVQVNKDGQGVLGSTVDIMQLGTPQVRLRPSVEVGFGSADRSWHLAAEVLYRFQPDAAPAIPYLGAGVGYYDDGTTTSVWPTLVMGFELPMGRSMSWLIEYHALDALRRSRFLVGLATRTGGL